MAYSDRYHGNKYWEGRVMIRFQLTNGDVVESPPMTEEVLSSVPESERERTLAQMLQMFKDFKSLTNLTVNNRVYNPHYIMWIELYGHEWLKERYPNLPWWDND
jgi:hypothetical protein